MIEFKTENQGTSVFLVYELNPSETIDNFGYGMVTNNKIAGISRFSITHLNHERFVKFNISGKVSLRQYFAGAVNQARFTSVMGSILSAIHEAEQYMLEPNQLVLDANYIYCNVSNGQAELIYLPVHGKEIGQSFYGFVKDLVFSTQFDQSENCDYVAKIIAYLHINPNFSLADFRNFIMGLPEAKKQHPKPAPPALAPVAAAVPAAPVVLAPPPQAVKIPTPPPPALPPAPPAKPAKRGWFGFGQKEKPPKEKPAAPALPVPPLGTKPGSFGETTVLCGPSLGETIVLREPSVNNTRPYLVRIKNGQKVFIEKSIFRMGREKRYVDFFIGDNTAIGRSHADIITRDGEYFIIDNNSKNYTYLDDVLLPAQVEMKLSHGVKIRLANEEFEFRLF